ncbi:MAG: hypothetical protein ABEH77_09230 [Halobacteriaceae archaeon]
MSEFPVRYYCPHCGTVVTLRREGYLADKSVTPYPLAGWAYAAPDEEFEDADGVRLRCGEGTPEWDGAGCGESFYLNFVRFEEGEAVAARPESEHVELATGERPPGPGGPSH